MRLLQKEKIVCFDPTIRKRAKRFFLSFDEHSEEKVHNNSNDFSLRPKWQSGLSGHFARGSSEERILSLCSSKEQNSTFCESINLFSKKNYVSRFPQKHCSTRNLRQIVTTHRQDRNNFHLTGTFVFPYHEKSVLVTETSSTLKMEVP